MIKTGGVTTIICDPKKLQTIRITCRCGKQWTERIPGEVHDSDMAAYFECISCGRAHLLRNHVLTTMTKEEFHDRFNQQQAFDVTGDAKRTDKDASQYDA